MPFIEDISLERRKLLSKKIISIHPDRIPIIIMPNKRYPSIYEWFFSFFVKFEKEKLQEKKVTAEHSTPFLRILQPLIAKGYKNFQYIDDEFIDINQNLAEAYFNKKSEDGFLYIKY